MYAFLPSTPLSSAKAFHKSLTPIRRPAHNTRPRHHNHASISMWSMDDLPEELRIPERPRIGFSDYSEKLNGRLAMIGFVAAVLIELFTGQGLVPLVTSFLEN